MTKLGRVLPTGTVTFMLTDIVGSTRTWEADEAAAGAAVARHYELLHDVISRHGGVRPLEQGEGDSTVAVFGRAADAVVAALDAQAAFDTEPWPCGLHISIRLAIHTGEAQFRDEHNYMGRAVIRTARLRELAAAGQILLSETTAALVVDHLPADAGLVDLGIHRLADLDRHEHIWQLDHPSIHRSFPSLRTLDTFRDNLPAQLTPLIGRTTEVTELIDALRADRLVTLTGSGGIGKTRLAHAVATQLTGSFAGGVWWTDLAVVSDAAAVPSAVLTGCGGREDPGSSVTAKLVAHLGERPVLLVLDNCEHLGHPVAELVGELLAARPSITVLATSREPLGVSGEVTWRVPSLATPSDGVDMDAEELSSYDSVRLFVERARRARPSFTLTDANVEAIAQVCRRLDGIPLAIELAAARMRQMSAERIAADLDDCFRMLTGGARGLLPRQQTLLASVDWSHDRLDDGERRVFRRLSVLSGSFPLAAAEVIAAAPGDIEPFEIFDVMSRLVDKSLLIVEDTSSADVRYRLLETMRQYGSDRAKAADELVVLRDAHADWWTAWMEALTPTVPTDENVEEISAAYENCRAALEWRLEQPVAAARLTRCLIGVWLFTGRFADAVSLAGRAERAANDNPVATAVILTYSFYARLLAGEPCDESRLAAAVPILTEAGDHEAAAHARFLYILLFGGIDPARTADDIALVERGGNRWVRHDLVAVSAITQVLRGSLALAEQSLATLDAPVHISSSLIRMLLEMSIHAARGEIASCRDVAVELLALDPNRLDPISLGAAFETAAHLCALAGDGEAVQSCVTMVGLAAQRTPMVAQDVWFANQYRNILVGAPVALTGKPANVEMGSTWDVHAVMLAELLIHDGRTEEARVTLAELIAAPWLDPASWHACDLARVRGLLASIEGDHAAADTDLRLALAIAAERGYRAIAVDALEGLAHLLSVRGRHADALRLVGAADGLRERLGYRLRFQPGRDRDLAIRHAATDALGDGAADAAWSDGHDAEWHTVAAWVQRNRGGRGRPRFGWDSLTPTELAVIELAATGLTNARIGERLLMGPATVKSHLSSSFTKLGVANRTELAAELVRRSGTRT